MTRAVIDLQEDLSHVLPLINGAIKGSSFSQNGNILGFNYKGLGVIIEAKKITVNNAGDEVAVREVMDWLIKKISDNGRYSKYD